MAGLNKLILPGDSLTAADVASNFNALKAAVNSLGDDNFEPGSLSSRHFVPQSSAFDGLDFKSIYRREFNATTIPRSAYTEVVKLSLSKEFPRLYGENSVVFVFAELEVYNTAAKTTPIGAADTEIFGFELEFGQAAGGVPSTSTAAFVNATHRYVTPGSAVLSGSEPLAPAEVANLVLFGAARVSSVSTVFEAKVMARSFDYSFGSGDASESGRCLGAISALVVSR